MLAFRHSLSEHGDALDHEDVQGCCAVEFAYSDAMTLTPSQVAKAGTRIRRFLRGDDADRDRFWTSIDVLVEFRALHQKPLNAAQMGLRSAVKSDGHDPTTCVSSRLKRVPTIVDKLVREPTMSLANMQDIGGCRAILPTIADIRGVEKRLSQRKSRARELVDTRDYIAAPKATGYRGVHVIMRYHERLIEFQLRSPFMHQWALAVENLTNRYDEDYKGAWNDTITPWLALVSEAMALEELGRPVPEVLATEIDKQRIMSETYLQRRPRHE